MSYDLNDAQPQMAPIGELIPDGTFAKVRLTVRPGGVDGATPRDAKHGGGGQPGLRRRPRPGAILPGR